ncbi:hypothetical protein BFF78_02970 [Streptomyces fodineus]|uniref:Uncharacterized protein n=1 Tax=Streptomyces fodineus TaxID=1904616 RepID=A0A1D7Y3J9_9ACTN|nr:hypothetical protein [Streptomyces fodineus]AOR30161.1 hypothetical protein BFF78_02970 [Streptomyces fodineus]
MDLDAVADELYGLRPEEFVAARDSRAVDARRAGDQALAREIGSLRRPSLAAWVGNLLVRRQPEQVEPLLVLGEELRRAHRELDGTQLRKLARRQNEVIGALGRQARRLAAEAGHPVGEGVQREVEETLHAVLADPEAAREWAAGRLVKPLSSTLGFPAADEALPAGRPAPPAAKPKKPARSQGRQADAEHRRRLAEAREQAREAERELGAREKEADAAGRVLEEAGARVAEAEGHVRELRERLRRAEEEQRRARAAEQDARERARQADRAVREARCRTESAAKQVERLTAGAGSRRP